jgi:hypothetical protein
MRESRASQGFLRSAGYKDAGPPDLRAKQSIFEMASKKLELKIPMGIWLAKIGSISV